MLGDIPLSSKLDILDIDSIRGRESSRLHVEVEDGGVDQWELARIMMRFHLDFNLSFGKHISRTCKSGAQSALRF